MQTLKLKKVRNAPIAWTPRDLSCKFHANPGPTRSCQSRNTKPISRASHHNRVQIRSTKYLYLLLLRVHIHDLSNENNQNRKHKSARNPCLFFDHAIQTKKILANTTRSFGGGPRGEQNKTMRRATRKVLGISDRTQATNVVDSKTRALLDRSG